MHKPSGKILVIRLSSLGDIILMVPMLRALRAANAGGEIHLLCKERYAGLFDGNTFVSRLHLVRRGDLRELAAIRSDLVRERYDTIIDAHNVIRSNLIFRTMRAPRKIQIQKDEIRKWLLIACKRNRYERPVTQFDRYGAIAGKLGISIPPSCESLPIPEAAGRSAQTALRPVLDGGRPLVAMAPGARWPTKMWPAEHFSRVASLAAKNGCSVILIGGAEDRAASAGIAENASPAPLDLMGRLSILESAAVLAKCDALITNDSAPLHLAEAVGTPVVALYGPTVREFGYFPRLPGSVALDFDLPCRPCSRNGARRCPYGTKECLAAIRPKEVLEALRTVLEERKSGG